MHVKILQKNEFVEYLWPANFSFVYLRTLHVHVGAKPVKKERRTLVQDEVRRIEVETRLTKAVTLKKQGK